MRSTLLWLAAAAAIAGGHVLAAAATAPERLALAVVVLWLLACALALSVAWSEGRRRLAIALLGAALLRGITASGGTARPTPAGDRATDWPVPRGPGARVRTFVVTQASWPGARCQVRARPAGLDDAAWLELPGEACPLADGDVIAIAAGDLEIARGPSWPGGVDPLALARSREALWAVRAERPWRRESGDRGRYWSAIARLRTRLWQASRGDDAQAFVVSSLFGVRAALSSPRRRALGVAGLGHLVAVSGMQVSLVAWVAHRVALRLTAPWCASVGLAFACSMVPVVGYVGLVGAEAPAVRAAIMVAALGMAAAWGRPAHGITVLAWTSAVMLAVRPQWALDVGFQLSFAAMAAIIRAPAGTGLALQSWRVGWAIMPVIVWHFGETGAWAVPANLLAVPVFSAWVTPAGVLAVVLAPVLGELAWAPARWGAGFVLDVAALFAAAPRVAPAWVAIVAAIAAIAGRVPRLREHPRWRAWLPSLPACALVVAAVVLRGQAPSAPAAQWFACGPRTAPTIITRAADGSGCIRDPTGSPQAWPPLLEALGVTRVGQLVGGADDDEGAPHVVAVRDELDAVGRVGQAQCPAWPTRAAVRAAFAACARHEGAPFVGVHDDTVHCFVAGDWHGPLRLHSGAP